MDSLQPIEQLPSPPPPPPAAAAAAPSSSSIFNQEEKQKFHWARDLPPLLQGIILPSIKSQFGLSQYVVSIVFLCTTAGYMLAALANGHLIRRYNQVITAMIGSISLVCGYLIFSCTIPFPVLCVCCNVICSEMPKATVMLNFLHAFYGFGALIGPLIASSVHGWQDTYRIFCGLAGLNIILQFFTFGTYSQKEKQNDEETTTTEVETNSTTTTTSTTAKKDDDNSKLIYDTLHQPILYAGAVFLLLYVGTEVCIGNWGYTFLITARSSDTVAMARIMSGIGAGSVPVGEKRMIYGYVSVLIGMLLLLWLVPLVAVNATALVIIGITIGPLFPTTVALTSKVVPEHLRATTIGFYFGSGGSALFPYVGGVLIGSLGVGSLLPFCISLASMMLISWLFVPNPDTSKSVYQWLLYPIIKRIRLLRC
ncbi:major facilitator superfamily domain-containing protein [Absidia repens]|uniref:Major facilitator superfamily domain-containing protein n=1 Tax=Absidia repens TaxID=90262 RepID=A0A1X2HXL9_9FUNG|nr:major facilitator superfamily domain-containing protein [Absidia repens]